MKVGVLVTGEIAVRAAHSLQAHPAVDQVVVVGPAKSRNFEVVDEPVGCDFLVGNGGEAPTLARRHGLPLVWDGDHPAEGVRMWGASPVGVALALAAREPDPRLVAVAHPLIDDSHTTRTTRFPDPLGRLGVRDAEFGGRPVAIAHSPNEFAACLAVGAERRVAVVDHGEFMSGVALGAGVIVASDEPAPVWDHALPYLETITTMGLVMAQSGG
ncbi:MAG TPA: hypothetical protein VJ948_01880 [Acidimicrobiia bacterium]|nr:hypothetical protein [Acidimicrobiia bacterium]